MSLHRAIAVSPRRCAVSKRNFSPRATRSLIAAPGSLCQKTLTSASVSARSRDFSSPPREPSFISGDDAIRSRVTPNAIEPVQTLNPASWTRVPVVLEGVPPSGFGFLRVKNVRHKGIKLYGH
jgi:hypothetical protein